MFLHEGSLLFICEIFEADIAKFVNLVSGRLSALLKILLRYCIGKVLSILYLTVKLYKDANQQLRPAFWSSEIKLSKLIDSVLLFLKSFMCHSCCIV